jgi:hypothetical protein
MTSTAKYIFGLENLIVRATIKNTHELNVGVLFTFYLKNRLLHIKCNFLFHKIAIFIYPKSDKA